METRAAKLREELTAQEQVVTETQHQYNNRLSLDTKAEQDCQTRIKKLTEYLQDSELVNGDLGAKNGELYQLQNTTLQALQEERTSSRFLQAALNTARLERDDSRSLHKDIYKELLQERT